MKLDGGPWFVGLDELLRHYSHGANGLPCPLSEPCLGEVLKSLEKIKKGAFENKCRTRYKISLTIKAFKIIANFSRFRASCLHRVLILCFTLLLETMT